MHIHIFHCLSAPVHICEYYYTLPLTALVSWFRGLSYTSFSTLDYIPSHPNSVHFVSPQISLISFNHPWHIFVTATYFPVSSIWPRHIAQHHLHSPSAHYLNSPPCPPLHTIPVLPHTAYISCTILKAEAAKLLHNVDSYIQIYTAWYPTRLKYSSLPLWGHQFSYFTFSEPCIVIHTCEKDQQQDAHFFLIICFN